MEIPQSLDIYEMLTYLLCDQFAQHRAYRSNRRIDTFILTFKPGGATMGNLEIQIRSVNVSNVVTRNIEKGGLNYFNIIDGDLRPVLLFRTASSVTTDS